jgi:hypothetical protein
MYRTPLLTEAVTRWWRPPSLPSAVLGGEREKGVVAREFCVSVERLFGLPLSLSRARALPSSQRSLSFTPSPTHAPGQDVVLVVGLALGVLGLLDVQQGGGGDLVRAEAALGPGLAGEDLLAQQGADDLVQELVGRAVAVDGGGGRLAGDDVDVVDGVAVVLVREHHARHHLLAAGVPLGGQEQGEAVAGVGDEAGGVGGLGVGGGGVGAGARE